jgi:hypothetical protein
MATRMSEILGIPEKELINKSLVSLIEKEIRLAEMDIGDLREKYDVASKDELYDLIKSRKIESHPSWEDYITWKNKEKYIEELKGQLRSAR